MTKRKNFTQMALFRGHEGVSKCTFWLHPRGCVRMAKMQGAEDEGAGSVQPSPNPIVTQQIGYYDTPPYIFYAVADMT